MPIFLDLFILEEHLIMCGILGYISSDKLNNKLSLELLEMMKRSFA